MKDSPGTEARHKRVMERIVALTLQIGVITSVVLVLAGAAVTFWHHPEYVHGTELLKMLTGPDNDFPKTLHNVFAGLAAFRGQSIIVLGLMVLLATPVLRVAISALIFLLERDGVFVAITLFVLGLLVVSFFLGRVE